MNRQQAIGQGAIRFALVSLISYAIWAFGATMGTVTLYSSITVVFLGLSGLLLFPLLEGERRVVRTYLVFVPGFLIYAILWCVGWFGLKGNAGEIFGSAAGLAGFAFWISLMLKNREGFLVVWAVLFLFHTLGYTLGGVCYYSTYGRAFLAPVLEGHTALGRLLWGLFHGLGFGAGYGFALHFWRRTEA